MQVKYIHSDLYLSKAYYYLQFDTPPPPHVKCLDKMKQRNPLVGGVSNSRLMYYESDAILNETPGPW